MSFLKRICWWCSGNEVGPEKDFTIILGNGTDKRSNYKRGKYGTNSERMTSPGRVAMREHIATPDSKTSKETFKSIQPLNEPKIERNLTNKEESKDEELTSGEHLTNQNKLNGKETDENKRGSLYRSFNLKGIFERIDSDNKLDKKASDTDNWVIYVEGPLEKYTQSSLKLEYSGKSVVTKMACGFAHMILLLENGEIFVSGNNTQGQLNLDPSKSPEIEGLVLHESINKRYEVVDIGWGSNHSVFLAREKDTLKQERRLLTCGYEGCLGVLEVNEDEYRLQTVSIPELSDYDKIEFLICKFNSSAILDNDNNLYYWGDDFDGFRERIPEKKNLFSDRIVDISFGFRHAVILLENGDVYTWGDGTYGELSTAFKASDSNAPIKINYFKKNNIQIIKVEAGSRHSLFLDKKGNVYGCGLTKGKNHNTERMHSPILLEDISDFEVIDIFWGDTTSYAIDCNGIPYKWGGVTGKFEIISDVSGRYISQVVAGNNNLIVLA